MHLQLYQALNNDEVAEDVTDQIPKHPDLLQPLWEKLRQAEMAVRSRASPSHVPLGLQPTPPMKNAEIFDDVTDQ